jgi:hypothetical protein
VICGFDLDGNHAAVDLPHDAVAYLDYAIDGGSAATPARNRDPTVVFCGGALISTRCPEVQFT